MTVERWGLPNFRPWARRCPAGRRGQRRRGRRWWGGSAGWSRSIRGGMRADLFAANSLDEDGRNWTYLFQEPFRRSRASSAVAGAGGQAGDDPLFHTIVDLDDRQGRRRGDLHAHRPGQRRDRGRQHQLLAAAAEDAGRHRGHVPDDGARVRRARLPALRVEVRFPQCAVAGGGAAAGLPVRGPVPAGGRSTRAATATRPGSPSSTANGRR